MFSIQLQDTYSIDDHILLRAQARVCSAAAEAIAKSSTLTGSEFDFDKTSPDTFGLFELANDICRGQTTGTRVPSVAGRAILFRTGLDGDSVGIDTRMWHAGCASTQTQPSAPPRVAMQKFLQLPLTERVRRTSVPVKLQKMFDRRIRVFDRSDDGRIDVVELQAKMDDAAHGDSPHNRRLARLAIARNWSAVQLLATVDGDIDGMLSPEEYYCAHTLVDKWVGQNPLDTYGDTDNWEEVMFGAAFASRPTTSSDPGHKEL